MLPRLVAALGLAGAGFGASAGKRRRLKFNQFGCVDVGGRCRGKDSACCSGICRGKKPKKGERDRSRCVLHDLGTGCRPGATQDECGGMDEPCTTSAGRQGTCGTTTGNAAYYANAFPMVTCTRDKDCQDEHGPRAACLKCPTMVTGTICGVVDPGDLL